LASLDVLDYLQGLETALASRLPAGLRRPAVREARRVLETLAFRFAILDERPLPEDLDYLRAIEAMKPPARAAEVLARRRPIYARARRRRLITTWTILAFLAIAIGGLAYLATSEKADTVAAVNQRAAVDVSYAVVKNFTIAPNVNRLHVAGDFSLGKATSGTIEVRLRYLGTDNAPVNETSLTFNARERDYLRENVLDPKPGNWQLFVDFEQVTGSAIITVDAITPTR
jgi:hypothetical protein